MKVVVRYFFDGKDLEETIKDCKACHINVEFGYTQIVHNDDSEEYFLNSKLFTVRKYK